MPTNYTSLIQQAITQYSNDGEGLYNELLGIHTLAKQNGDSIVYPGGRTLNITVCLDVHNNPQEIPLPDSTNFMGCTFNVANNTGKEFYLFSLKQSSNPNTVTLLKGQLKKNVTIYGQNNELDSTPKLIIINDQTPWTYRTEYNENNELVTTPFNRKDILYVVGNVIQNNPIMNYDSSQSLPMCQYINVGTNQKTFENIVFNRTGTSNAVTNLIAVENQYNVLLQSIVIVTPQQHPDNGMYHDSCIDIRDSAKIILNSIVINHTYSAIYHWGYGIRLINVWDTSISHLTAYNPARGVMGNDHVNELTVEDSDLNRVDIHCYGRDITCTNCTFRNITNTYHIYNRVSSFYGKLIYTNCIFNNFLPLRIDSAYNAFTPFDMILDNCTLNVNNYHLSIVNTETLVATSNSRTELQAKCLPNIVIRNLHLNIPSNLTDFYFIRIFHYAYTGSIHYMNTFLVDIIEYTGPSSVNIYDFKYIDTDPLEYDNYSLILVEPLRRNINMIRKIVGGS